MNFTADQTDMRARYVTNLLQQSRGGSFPAGVFRLPTSVFQLPTPDFWFRLPTSIAMKDGGRPTRLLPYAKMLLAPITFFPLLLGRLCSGRFRLSRLVHTERSWHTYRFTVVFVSGRQDLPSDSRAYSLKLFITAEPKGFNFLQSAFWTWITIWLFLVREYAMLYHAGPSSLVFFAGC